MMFNLQPGMRRFVSGPALTGRRSGLLIRFFTVACFSLAVRSAQAQNFSSSDPELRQAAEVARERSAKFWSGRSLPGNWFAPCPIEWSVQRGTGSGSTRFRLANGEVFGWQMTVCGDRTAVLQDVLPHEVDHAVRATLVRRPLPRWLDEGCASLCESEATHAQLREQLRTSRRRLLTPATIDQLQYPSTADDSQQLYAEGFSLVEFLLSRGPSQELMQVQRSSTPPSQSLVEVYREPLPRLLASWQTWEQSRLSSGARCDCVNCPWHHPQASPGAGSTGRPALVVWSAAWCGPCREFHRDLATNERFRKRLESRFQIVIRDVDQVPLEAKQSSITSVPVFMTPDHRVTGYLGPEWLLRELGMNPSITTAPNVAPAPEVKPLVITAPVTPSKLVLPALPNPTPSKPLPDVGTQAAPPSVPATSVGGRIANALPSVITILTSLGVISGSAVTGGVGGLALMLAWRLLRRRLAGPANTPEGGVAPTAPAPFPRHLDEAGELLGLRQSEGRVATLDALRGMFLDDEFEKLKDDPDSRTRQIVSRLRANIDHRVDEAAPLTTKV